MHQHQPPIIPSPPSGSGPVVRPGRLPSSFAHHAFKVADAKARGVSKRQLGGGKLTIPTRGVRSHQPLLGVADRVTAFDLVLPEDVAFSHLTAAHMWGLAIPWTLGRETPIEIMRGTNKAPIERRGCQSHRGLERRVIQVVDGVQLTSIADTWLDIIEKYYRRLSVTDAVLIGDAAVELLVRTRPVVDELGKPRFDVPERHPQVEPESELWWTDPVNAGIRILRERLLARGRFRGKAMAVAALPLIRARVWSPMETRSRLVIVGGNIPEPLLNATVRDGRSTIITIGDLVWRKQRLIGAYNGPTHEQERARVTDNDQRLLLEDAGWALIEIYSKDVNTAKGCSALIRRFGAALNRPLREPVADW